ncbi:plastocyanin/azurin family copper-binding protein [Microvirga lotononidis]|uniref:Plastocyanin n=1 Tax=Microvirga lotononidis TaxID=864069 RepID=I4Z0S5_9HYPH|nr:plastocyanin/azurin family copper-binding protein [Microvirga lotononidis]EIM29817.1 plastocyanin [Microvirga lotononidis]WQO31093.1 plastocyanin/azurin family copper-binding protein [Microvirga lotononidis]
MVSRRHILRIGGGLLAGLALPRLPLAAEAVEIQMQGNADGSQVWFNPIGLRIKPGQTIRWVNLDPGNSHTATAYHPKNFERPLRIPEGAEPWNSDYLLPNESFSVTLKDEGVYDFFCVPHEHAGMVGRIIVGEPDRSSIDSGPAQAAGGEPIPEIALRAFPSVDEIMRRGIVRPA